MEQRKEGPLAAEQPRLRRKLQKSVRKQQSSIASRFRLSSSSQASATNERNITHKQPTPPTTSHLPRTPCQPSSTYEDDVSARIKSPSCTREEQILVPPERLSNRTYVVPELCHLVSKIPPPQPSPDRSRSPTREVRKMRRRAKTPILSIGQLEEIARPGNALSRTSSVELIAEQYRVMLESRRSSVYSDAYSEPPSPTPHSDRGDFLTMRRRRRSGYLPEPTFTGPYSTPTGGSVHMVEQPSPSPASDDGTLVSFQDEAVYFKPFSFEPAPESPPPPPGPPLSRYSSAGDDNVGLQICLDLLTRELSSAMAGRPGISPAKTSALQVWVMIEAYERLRDQLAELSQGNEQARALEMMFDTWLRALSSIHGSLTGGGRGDGADYGRELGTEELD